MDFGIYMAFLQNYNYKRTVYALLVVHFKHHISNCTWFVMLFVILFCYVIVWGWRLFFLR